jgi:hypothetical protein
MTGLVARLSRRWRLHHGHRRVRVRPLHLLAIEVRTDAQLKRPAYCLLPMASARLATAEPFFHESPDRTLLRTQPLQLFLLGSSQVAGRSLTAGFGRSFHFTVATVGNCVKLQGQFWNIRKNQTMEPLLPLLFGIDIDIDIEV